MKKIAITITLLLGLLLPLVVNAQNTFSTISTTFKIQKNIRCDKLTMVIRVWAKGNTYPEAIKRLRPINNNLMQFLNKIYSKKEIRTQISYNGPKIAETIITINTKKIRTAPAITRFIEQYRFPYQTGVQITDLRYSISQKTLDKVKQTIFKEALIKSKQLLAIINSSLHGKYQVYKINITYSQPFIINDFTPTLMFKSKGSNPGKLNMNAGTRTITATVHFSAISRVE